MALVVIEEKDLRQLIREEVSTIIKYSTPQMEKPGNRSLNITITQSKACGVLNMAVNTFTKHYRSGLTKVMEGVNAKYYLHEIEDLKERLNK